MKPETLKHNSKIITDKACKNRLRLLDQYVIAPKNKPGLCFSFKDDPTVLNSKISFSGTPIHRY